MAEHQRRPNRPQARRSAGPGAKPARVSPARRAAFEVLEAVANTSAHSDDLLHGKALAGLSQPDRNLATALVLGTLRWQLALEDRLLPLLDHPDQALPGAVQTALLLGAFQLLHMDRIPVHAALNESVELVRWAGVPKAAGLVNAVLRKLAAAPAAKKPIYESAQAASRRLGHPAWLMERWVRQYGQAAALAICEYDQKEPCRGDLFVSTSPNDVKGAERRAEPKLEKLDESEPGRMDDGSRLVAELAAVSQDRVKNLWDCCAAPGGKTLVLAHRHAAAAVLATDISPKRLRTLRDRLERELPGRDVRTEVADAAEAEGITSSGQTGFDLILCDVPCSGTGTLARNPEIRQRLKPADLLRQTERQKRILQAALGRLASGGKLLYSTCSLEPEENEAVVEAVLAKSVGVRVESLSGPLQSLRAEGRVRNDAAFEGLLRGPYLRTLPGSGFQGEGFFAALVVKD